MAVKAGSAGFDPKTVIQAGLRSTRNLPFIQHLPFGLSGPCPNGPVVGNARRKAAVLRLVYQAKFGSTAYDTHLATRGHPRASYAVLLFAVDFGVQFRVRPVVAVNSRLRRCRK